MIRSALLAASFLAIAAPAASAQVSVIGGGIASDCYEAALYGRISPQEGERICTKAIQAEMMKLDNRAATYTNRGVLRMRAGDYDGALSDYGTAKKMKPSLFKSYNANAACILSSREPEHKTLIPLANSLESTSPSLLLSNALNNFLMTTSAFFLSAAVS